MSSTNMFSKDRRKAIITRKRRPNRSWRAWLETPPPLDEFQDIKRRREAFEKKWQRLKKEQEINSVMEEAKPVPEMEFETQKYPPKQYQSMFKVVKRRTVSEGIAGEEVYVYRSPSVRDQGFMDESSLSRKLPKSITNVHLYVINMKDMPDHWMGHPMSEYPMYWPRSSSLRRTFTIGPFRDPDGKSFLLTIEQYQEYPLGFVTSILKRRMQEKSEWDSRFFHQSKNPFHLPDETIISKGIQIPETYPWSPGYKKSEWDFGRDKWEHKQWRNRYANLRLRPSPRDYLKEEHGSGKWESNLDFQKRMRYLRHIEKQDAKEQDLIVDTTRHIYNYQTRDLGDGKTEKEYGFFCCLCNKFNKYETKEWNNFMAEGSEKSWLKRRVVGGYPDRRVRDWYCADCITDHLIKCAHQHPDIPIPDKFDVYEICDQVVDLGLDFPCWEGYIEFTQALMHLVYGDKYNEFVAFHAIDRMKKLLFPGKERISRFLCETLRKKVQGLDDDIQVEDYLKFAEYVFRVPLFDSKKYKWEVIKELSEHWEEDLNIKEFDREINARITRKTASPEEYILSAEGNDFSCWNMSLHRLISWKHDKEKTIEELYPYLSNWKEDLCDENASITSDEQKKLEEFDDSDDESLLLKLKQKELKEMELYMSDSESSEGYHEPSSDDE